MKPLIKSLVAVLFAGLLAVPVHALSVEFSVAQGTGYVDVQTVADLVDVGPTGTGYPTAPATALWALGNFGNYPNGPVDARATVDRSYSKMRHYIGYYAGGDNAYLTIY